ERLVVCGAQGVNKIPEGCWYGLVRAALEDDCISEPADDGLGEVLRYRKGEPEPMRAVEANEPAAAVAVPAWLTRAAPVETPSLRTVTPSSSDDETRRAASPGSAQALLRGSLTHRLMQSLPDIPPDRRRAAAEDF